MERLGGLELGVLFWDDFGWSGDIGALAILDGASLLDDEGELRIEAVRRRIEPRLHLVPRLRQCLYRPRRGLGWPVWVDSASFDLADHVRAVPLEAPGERAQLLRACQQLAPRRLDPTRPLWQMWLLPGLPQRRVGLFMKMHHTIADGIAGVATFRALLDPAADKAEPATPPWTPALAPTTGELLRDNLGRRGHELARMLSSVAHPAGTLRRSRATWPAWREFFTEQRAPRTSLNRPIGADRSFALIGTRLDVARQIAQAQHATVNDVVLAAVAAGLRELLCARGEHIDQLVLRAMVPVSLHRQQTGQASGNQAGSMVVPLPIAEPDHARRLQLIAAQTARRKTNAHPQMGSGVFRFAAAQRVFLHLFARQRLFNLSVTNIPGPPMPLYLAGAPLLEMYPVVSLVANLTLDVAVLSYAGQLNITAIADQDGCPDVELFAQGVRRALGDLAQATLVPSS